MALAERELVDSQLMEAAQVDCPAGPFDIMVQDPPQPIGMHRRHLRDRGHRHLQAQRQDQKLEQQRKSTAGSGPRHFNLLHPTGAALDPWHPGMEIRLVLEEVEMPPSPLQGVMDVRLSSVYVPRLARMERISSGPVRQQPPMICAPASRQSRAGGPKSVTPMPSSQHRAALSHTSPLLG